jgi:hypothetical protein
MAHTTTWEPLRGDGDGTLPESVYAFPKQRIDPLIDAVCVRSALEHVHTIPEVSDEDREQAFDNIKRAATHFHVEIYGNTYEEMCCRPQVEVLPRD